MENKVECSCGYYQQDFLENSQKNMNILKSAKMVFENNSSLQLVLKSGFIRKARDWMMKAWQWLNLLIFTHNAYIVTLVDLKTRNILDNPELA